MTQTIISNEDIRGIVERHIGEILDYYAAGYKRDCGAGYMPQGLLKAAIVAILEIPNLAIVDRDAELPCSLICPNCDCPFTKIPAEILTEEGWVKECL